MMKSLNDKHERIFLPLSSIARELGCSTAKLEQWLKDQPEVELRRTGPHQLEVDPVQLRECLNSL